MEKHSDKAIHKYIDNYVIIDVETTDKYVNFARIVEIGAIKVRKGKIVDTFSTLINPNRKISLDASKKSNITDEMVKDSPSFNEVVDDLLKFIEGEILVGFNISSFDYIILNNEVERCIGEGIDNKFLDLRYDLERELFELENHKLETICKHLGINNPYAHRALNDCYMVEACYRWLRADRDYANIEVPYIETIPFEEKPEQIVMEDDGSNEWTSKIQHMLNALVMELELPEHSLYLGANLGRDNRVTSYSVCIYEPEFPSNPNIKMDPSKNSSVMVIKEKNNILTLSLKKLQYENVVFDKSLKTKVLKSQPNMINVIMNKDDENLIEFIRLHTIYRVTNYTSKAATFSCCSQFVACSDAKKCVHVNKLYSKACSYRRNLESGRIFYGKNKNI